MGITNWPFRANFSRTEALHDMIERPKLCISVQVSRAHLPSPALYSIMRGCADFILCRCNIFTGQKSVGWITWGFIPPVADFRCVLHCSTAHEMWVLHQNNPSIPTGNLPWHSSWWFSERAAASLFARPWLSGWSVPVRSVPAFWSGSVCPGWERAEVREGLLWVVLSITPLCKTEAARACQRIFNISKEVFYMHMARIHMHDLSSNPL